MFRKPIAFQRGNSFDGKALRSLTPAYTRLASCREPGRHSCALDEELTIAVRARGKMRSCACGHVRERDLSSSAETHNEMSEVVMLLVGYRPLVGWYDLCPGAGKMASEPRISARSDLHKSSRIQSQGEYLRQTLFGGIPSNTSGVGWPVKHVFASEEL